jgi:hypothetical protein
MKHNSAKGANTMEFPTGKFASGANTIDLSGNYVTTNTVFNLGPP